MTQNLTIQNCSNVILRNITTVHLVRIRGSSNIRVDKCVFSINATIPNYSERLQINDSKDITIFSNRFSGYSKFGGVEIDHSSNVEVRDNRLGALNYGFSVGNSTNLLFDNNTISGCLTGLGARQCTNITLQNNLFDHSRSSCISLMEVNQCWISNNNFTWNLGFLLEIFDGAEDVLFNNNTIVGADRGFSVYLWFKETLSLKNIEIKNNDFKQSDVDQLFLVSPFKMSEILGEDKLYIHDNYLNGKRFNGLPLTDTSQDNVYGLAVFELIVILILLGIIRLLKSQSTRIRKI